MHEVPATDGDLLDRQAVGSVHHRHHQSLGGGDGDADVHTGALDEHVLVGAKDDPAWMRGGSYLVTRRIRMMLEIWDRSTLADQELTIGRNKQEGAPLGGAKEHDTVDLTAKKNGDLAIPTKAHIRLAAPSENKGIRLLRRGFSFTDGIDPVTNQLDSGLFFIAYQRDRPAVVKTSRRMPLP